MVLSPIRLRPPLVLAYHGLGPHRPELDPHNLMVDPLRFRAQVQTLRRRGYRFVALGEYVDGLATGHTRDGVCALTFDDGTLDNLHTLAPILRELALPATVFACPGLLGEPHFAMPAEAGVRLMNAQELRELAELPLVEIGSHTNRHTDLSLAGEQEAYAEMASSRQALEELLQRPVRAFAYPKCGYSPACPQAARRAGYTVAVTCGGRGGADPFELARESIDPLDGRLGFALKSRRLFVPLRDSLPGRLARGAVRPVRHRGTASM
ncbi:MAG TPA: polysaccharide deacetylase family protein [Solirubrobacteraceae bacterium]|jgi:peptidoglycan/xylan/chitin deacetylase (PgdA/CDA1 family)|nr:polysaccharide deacetylase family protein [Solirubrobacteraceae bacterium]